MPDQEEDKEKEDIRMETGIEEDNSVAEETGTEKSKCRLEGKLAMTKKEEIFRSRRRDTLLSYV